MSRLKWKEIEWWVINLLHRKDRLEHITGQMQKAGLRWNRFEALRKEDYQGPSERVEMMQKTPNTIGNWLSHTAVITKAVGSAGAVGLLEDDALLCSDFCERLQYIEENLQWDWDLFFLGGTFHTDKAVWHPELGHDFEETAAKHLVRVYGAFSNQGYLINGPSAPRILELMAEKMPQSTGSDHALIQIQPMLRCYAFVPGMVFQIDSQSDIGEGVTQFSHFLESLGPHAWCDRLADFDYAEWQRTGR